MQWKMNPKTKFQLNNQNKTKNIFEVNYLTIPIISLKEIVYQLSDIGSLVAHAIRCTTNCERMRSRPTNPSQNLIHPRLGHSPHQFDQQFLQPWMAYRQIVYPAHPKHHILHQIHHLHQYLKNL